jgi:hypothetical protein
MTNNGGKVTMANPQPDAGGQDSIEAERSIAAFVDPAKNRIRLEISPVDGVEFSVWMSAERFQQSLPELMACALQLGVPWPKLPS